MTNCLLSDNYSNDLADSLRGAAQNIYMQIYVIKGKIGQASDPINTLINILALKIAAGIDIKILIDNPSRLKTNRQTNNFFFTKFQQLNIPFALNSGMTSVHGKVISIDQKMIYIGSHNLTRTSLSNPFEYSIRTDDPEIVSSFDKDFLTYWNAPAYKKYPPNRI
jgi:phosphatidylserine/phosphatidylglycerophosphate/cardiolipin synthase-like enzyme